MRAKELNNSVGQCLDVGREVPRLVVGGAFAATRNQLQPSDVSPSRGAIGECLTDGFHGRLTCQFVSEAVAISQGGKGVARHAGHVAHCGAQAQ